MTGVQTCALPICLPVTIGAEERINQTDWNLIAAMVYALKEAEEHEKKLKSIKKTIKTKE